jgi:hypothetical protein
MPSYPVSIRRCQHIKVNGTQCGSPALRAEKYCYFHAICHRKGKDAILYLNELETAMLPTLEDANSIQLGLAGVIRQLVNREINPKMAALLLYALQTASANLKYTSFEPEPTRVVIDRECVARRPIGATAWSTVEGREYDEIEKDDVEKDDLDKEVEKECRSKEGQEFMADLQRLSDGVARDPGFLDKRVGELGGEQKKEPAAN